MCFTTRTKTWLKPKQNCTHLSLPVQAPSHCFTITLSAGGRAIAIEIGLPFSCFPTHSRIKHAYSPKHCDRLHFQLTVKQTWRTYKIIFLRRGNSVRVVLLQRATLELTIANVLVSFLRLINTFALTVISPKSFNFTWFGVVLGWAAGRSDWVFPNYQTIIVVSNCRPCWLGDHFHSTNMVKCTGMRGNCIYTADPPPKATNTLGCTYYIFYIVLQRCEKSPTGSWSWESAFAVL